MFSQHRVSLKYDIFTSRNCWEAPTFHFNSANQSEDWRAFYTRALDYLDTLDIELDEADDNHKGWKQIKLMFEGEDRHALQTLIDNGTMTPEHIKTSKGCTRCNCNYY